MAIIDNNESKQTDGLHLTRTQTSRVVAGFLLCNLFVFVGGYFWGKRSAAVSLIEGVEHDAFTDQISYSLYTLYDQDKNDAAPVSVITDVQPIILAEHEAPEIKPAEEAETNKKYCAHLVGYRTKKAASNFSKKLAQKGVQTFVRERSGKSAAGKEAPKWYQVISAAYEDKAELLTLVDTIKKEEKIESVRIVTI